MHKHAYWFEDGDSITPLDKWTGNHVVIDGTKQGVCSKANCCSEKCLKLSNRGSVDGGPSLERLTDTTFFLTQESCA